MTSPRTVALLALLGSILSPPAHAGIKPDMQVEAAPADAPHPIELPDPSAAPWIVSAPAELPDDEPMPLQYRREFGIIPLVGGDSDIGVALGTVGSLASFTPYAKPYAYRLEINALISFKRSGDLWVNPFQDYYLKFTVPSLLHNKLSLTGRLAYTRYGTLKYYGIGNQSVVPSAATRTFNQFKLSYPHATFELAHAFAKPWLWKLVLDYLYEMPLVYENSQLRRDINRPSSIVLGGNEPFHLGMLTLGLGYDSRNDQTAPDAGQNHALSVRYSPSFKDALPYAFVGFNLSLRAYLPIWRRHIMLALRLVGDGLVGDVPFFMLAESVDGYAVGGVSGVRGVPAQRYYGKVKTYGTAELRLRFHPFKAFNQDMVWGMVAFADAGRVWADWHRNVALDGTGYGIKYGVGGGIRMQWGSTFLIRGDVAWSPDAQPLGFYFNVGHIF